MKLPDWQNWSLSELIGQMIVVRTSGYLYDHQIRYPAWEANSHDLQRWLQELNLGGVILLGGSTAELRMRCQQLQNWARTPLLIAADIEEGVGHRFAGATWFGPPMAVGAIAAKNPQQAISYAEQMGAITAQEALACGINWVLAPVADVNNNPLNPVINVRAFGDCPDTVSQLATAFIRGAKKHPVLTTAKHFPGHGDTTTDSHLSLPSLTHSSTRLAQIELPPFAAAIAAGVDSVMTAHLQVSAWDRHPASLSVAAGSYLRQQLGFEGLIVTDALIMGGVSQNYSATEIATKAVEAGADILLMPQDPQATIEAIAAAVRRGEIDKARIEASVARIWQAKGQVKARYSTNPLQDLATVAHPQALDTAAAILRDSQTSNGQTVKPYKDGLSLIVVDDVFACSDLIDRHTPAVAIPRQLGYQVQLIDSTSFPTLVPEQSTILQIFARGNPFRGTAGLTAQAQQFYQQIIHSGCIQAVVVYGSPYVRDWLTPQLPNPEIAWVFTYGQNSTAQAIAWQQMLKSEINWQSHKFL